MKRPLLSLTLSLSLLLSGAPSFTAQAEAARGEMFPAVRAYTGQFVDVDPDAWYYENAVTLYELGLTNGRGAASRFAPEYEMTVAEVLTMAARLRSLYEYGDGETGPAQYGGSAWYLPYVSYLQARGVIGQEFDGLYSRAATRAQMAHILANILPQSLFTPVNGEIVAAGYGNRNFIKDVSAGTPYQQDILTLYIWGILSGMDRTGAFHPNENIPRCQVAAMVTRLVDSELRIELDWDFSAAYSRAGAAMPELVYSDGTFYPAPSLDNLTEIDANVRYMLSQGNRQIALTYPAGTLTGAMVNRLLEVFLNAIRGYVEQTYNAVRCAYSVRSGTVTLSFFSSLYEDRDIDRYRAATISYAAAVHDELWAGGQVTPGMSEYEKARVYFTWICDHCQYDFSSTDSSMSHTGYNVFTDGRAVCDGYTAAYNLLLKLEGITCTTMSRADHIWTVAELDGTTCHIDTTWGDQSGTVAYRFFAMTEADALARFSS